MHMLINYKNKLKFCIFFSTFIFFLIISPANAQDSKPVAKFKEVSGVVAVYSKGAIGFASYGQGLFVCDIVKTPSAGHAIIEHNAGFTITIEPESTLLITASVFDISGVALSRGLFHAQGELPDKTKQFRVTTPVAVLGVTGTGFLVAGANDGSSLVSVNNGIITQGMGQDVSSVIAGQKIEGQLVKGYAQAISGQISKEQAQSWRSEKEKDMKSRVKQTLDELARLQKQEDADWQKVQEQITQATIKIMQGKMIPEDHLFFRKVFDIEDRMSARMLLAIDLREWAGITADKDAQSERIRTQKVWEARNWQRNAWENATKGIQTQEQPENIKRAYEHMNEDIEQAESETPKTIEAQEWTRSLFPAVVEGVYLGITAEALTSIRPNAKTNEIAAIDEQGSIPVVYTEKQLSGGDWSKEGWFTGMYYFYKGKMIQGAFLAFTGTEKLRTQLLEKFTSLYGKPWRSRIEPDWAQPNIIKGSTLEWKTNGVEIVLISRIVPGLQGNTRGLELRIRFSGFDSVLENAGQFSEGSDQERQNQLKIDFPEFK
ncbi:MAG: FecR family protein [Candidatus Omnitrophota bacterium]